MGSWMIIVPENRAGQVLTDEELVNWAAWARADGMIPEAPKTAEIAAAALQDAGIAALRRCQGVPHVRA